MASMLLRWIARTYEVDADYPAAAEARSTEEPVAQVARRAAEHRGEGQGDDPAAGAQREPGGEGRDRERRQGDEHRVPRREAAARPGVADQPDGDPAGAHVAGRVGAEHQGLAHLVGGEHRGRDRPHRQAHAGRAYRRAFREKPHEADTTAPLRTDQLATARRPSSCVALSVVVTRSSSARAVVLATSEGRITFCTRLATGLLYRHFPEWRQETLPQEFDCLSFALVCLRAALDDLHPHVDAPNKVTAPNRPGLAVYQSSDGECGQGHGELRQRSEADFLRATPMLDSPNRS